MKHRLQTFLKNKLQWLALLTALLGVSQGIWANGSAAGPKGVYLNVNGTQTWYNVYSTSWNYTPACSGWGFKTATSISGQNLGTVTTLRIDGFAVIGWTDNADWVSGQLRWKVDAGSYNYYKVGNYGDCSGGVFQVQCTSGNDRVVGYKSSTNVNVLSGLSVGNHTLYLKPYGQMLYNCGDFNSVDHTELSATFTVPGWSTTSGSKAFGSVNVGSNSSATISLGTHYGATSTATSSVTGTNASDFSVTSVSATSVTVIFTPSAAGSRTATVTITDAYSKTYTLSVSGTGVTSCSTPSASDIAISSPSSATTLYLGTGSAPSVDQTVTATCSKGNTYLWSATPTTYTSSSCWPGTATRVSIANSDKTSATATFYHEGEYTATFKAGCSNTTDASKPAPKITVKPGHIYFDGPFFSGSGYDLTKHHVAIDTSTDQFVYEWTATSSNTVANNDFIISVGTSCIDVATSAYAIGNYADLTLNGLVIPDEDTSGKTNCNHNFRANIGTINVGDGLKLTIAYTGVNASNVPKYSVTLEKTCSAVSKSQYTMATQSKQWTGSAITPTITRADGAGTIKNYYYSTDGSTWTSGCPTTRGTYYIKIDVNAGSTYCAKDGIILDNTLTITRKSRTISISNTDVVCGAGTYTLSSTASAGSGTKTYSIKSDPSSIASIDGSTLALTGAGTFTVQVNITASGNYAAASGTKEFTVTLPTLSTSAATSISYTSAILNGSVSNVTCTPSASGFEYKKGSDAYTSVAAASATGSISKEISGLTPGTEYTFRTYTVVNGVTKYSSTRTFTTTSCSAPVISSSSLGAQSKCKDEAGTAMTVTASSGVGTLTYTWYKKNDTTPSGGTQVQTSTSNSYTPPTSTVGTLYYYCVVSSASPCASSTVNSGISGAVEIKAKPTLTISPAGTIYNYMPMTVSSDMDVATWSWTDSANLIDGYFTSELTRTATFKGKIKNQETTRAVTFTATGTNGCNGTVVQDITKDTESCN